MDEEKDYADCVDAFADHDYERASNLALNIFMTKRRFLWVMQLLLIGLERMCWYDQHSAMVNVAIDAFKHESWATAMLELTLGKVSPDVLRSPDLNERQLCQLDFYGGSRRLTLGDRDEARIALLSCAGCRTPYPEQHVAGCELAKPEPADQILERIAQQAVRTKIQPTPYDVVTCARFAAKLITDEEIRRKELILPCLEIIRSATRDQELRRSNPGLFKEFDEIYNRQDEAWLREQALNN
jgi:hypothetical protein